MREVFSKDGLQIPASLGAMYMHWGGHLGSSASLSGKTILGYLLLQPAEASSSRRAMLLDAATRMQLGAAIAPLGLIPDDLLPITRDTSTHRLFVVCARSVTLARGLGTACGRAKNDDDGPAAVVLAESAVASDKKCATGPPRRAGEHDDPKTRASAATGSGSGDREEPASASSGAARGGHSAARSPPALAAPCRPESNVAPIGCILRIQSLSAHVIARSFADFMEKAAF